MATSFFENLEERKLKFWNICLECARHHNERRGDEWFWPHEGVEDFFSFWTQTDSRGRMAFEQERAKGKWGIGHRMGSFMKHRRHIEAYWEAKLERARGKQRGKSLEQRRAEAQDEEAQSVYDRFFEEQEGKKIED